MNSKLWIRKALSMCICVALLATYSMVALASSGKIAGELMVSGKSINGEAPFATVNGEAAKSGRSIFSSSTITTPDSASAVINLGKLGKIELAPKTALAISFDENGISGDLSAGKVTVLGESGNVSIKTVDGNVVKLAAGESVSATGAQTKDDDDDDDGGPAWWVWGVVFGGAAAVILYTATQGDSRADLGGNGTVVSPTR